MAAAVASPAERISSLLTKYNKSGDGKIPADILMNIMERCANGAVSAAEIKAIAESMDEQKVGKVGINKFAGWMFSSLEERIDEWKTDEQLQQLCQVVPRGHKKLQLCFVCPDMFTDIGLGYIGRGLPSTLTHLSLCFEFSWTECKISSAGFGALLEGLPKGLKSLELIFRNEELNDEALEKLAAAMPPNLTKVWLSFKDNDEMTDKGLCKLIAALPMTLEELLLNFNSNTSFTDKSLEALDEYFRNRTMWLTKCFIMANSNENFTQAALQKMSSSLPKHIKELKLEFEKAC
eukprot:TRINITY_DN33614_c0_g1_i1.p1 TRINITY_DN33614_c0_g1~~TRINITY_DN33614_c0_g1_i1.p1  ORF type:complete len:292 (-),score=87.53 TRINITY_DN33614_c0_g1_i1:86-961(-)